MGFGTTFSAAARSETLGITTGIGVTITTGGGSGTYGSSATIGTAGFSYDGFILNIGEGSNRRWRLKVLANHGGTDQTIVEDLSYDNTIAANLGPANFFCPVRIPAGSILKVQGAASSAGSICYGSIVGFGGDAKLIPGFSRIVSLTDFTGIDPSNSITLTGNTLTGWTQIVASAKADIAAIWVNFTSLAQSYGSSGISIDVGYGGAGSEQLLFTNQTHVTTTYLGESGIGPIPCQIPAGTRLAARAQASLNTETHTMSAIYWGAVP